jgi:hypothetical protein
MTRNGPLKGDRRIWADHYNLLDVLELRRNASRSVRRRGGQETKFFYIRPRAATRRWDFTRGLYVEVNVDDGRITTWRAYRNGREAIIYTTYNRVVRYIDARGNSTWNNPSPPLTSLLLPSHLLRCASDHPYILQLMTRMLQHSLSKPERLSGHPAAAAVRFR